MTDIAISRPRRRLRARPGAAICGGAVTGTIQAASPLAFWWLEPRTVYALGLILIAAVYIGFSVADGGRARNPPARRH